MHFKLLLLYSTLHKGDMHQIFDTCRCGADVSILLPILLPEYPRNTRDIPVQYDLHVDLYHPERTLHTNGRHLHYLNPWICVCWHLNTHCVTTKLSRQLQ